MAESAHRFNALDARGEVIPLTTAPTLHKALGRAREVGVQPGGWIKRQARYPFRELARGSLNW